MKFISTILSLFTCLALLSFPATGEFLQYDILQQKDLEQMEALVQKKVKEAQSLLDQGSGPEDLEVYTDRYEQKAVEKLREALRLILSRPNRDNMVEKLLPDVRRQLKNLNAYDDTMSSLTAQAINGLKAKKIPLNFQGTYLFMLENIMSEIHPERKSNPDFLNIFKKIRDAKIKIPDAVHRERRKRMFKKFLPSEVATNVLKKLEQKKK